MTILAPGRLDLTTVLGMSHRTARSIGFTFAVHDAANWDRVHLPAADWLTAYHPSFGVAHLPFTAGETPRGEPCVGRIRIRAPEGARIRGRLNVQSIWRNMRGHFRTGSWEPLSVDVDFAGTHEIRGLPMGTYRLVPRFEVVGPGEEGWTFERSGDVTLSGERTEVVLPVGR